MPLVIPGQTSPLIDGRQSENAMLVRRGVQRLFLELGLAVLPELPLASGRRADLVALTRSGEIWIVEIKSSIEDWKVDRKWPIYREHCDRLFFATHPGVPADIFPRGLRVHSFRRLWRRDHSRCTGAQIGRRHPQSHDPAICPRQRGTHDTGRAIGHPSARDGYGVAPQRGARLARIRCSVRRCMLRRRAVSETLRSHIS